MAVDSLCIKCRGRGFCGSYCKILSKIKDSQPKIEKNFSGSSPPEIFVGHHNYPEVFAGILAPNKIGDTERMSSPEYWHEDDADIEKILNYRASMIYSRFNAKIKQPTMNNSTLENKKYFDIFQDIALASKSVDASFELKKSPKSSFALSSHTPMIGNPAPLKDAKIESNIHVEKKVDYLVNDTDNKSVNSIKELFNSRIPVSNIIKVLSAGLLGLKKQRKLVPTRWSITAVDDTLSKDLIKKIRYYPELQNILLFNGNYLGNYYEILLLPGEWGFEVIETSEKGGLWNPESQAIWHDWEFFGGRKTYAESVTGGYYAVRLPITEYLNRIKKQATVLVFRESRDEYWAPCGVGILRELVKEAFKKYPIKCETIEEALLRMQENFKTPIDFFKDKSVLLKRKKEQRRLFEF
ncbi:hypothetical protein J4465_01500 [Candidatus Pacearchaeota archaeon]|nr:hypothetical protein [Candidatus Pacearchaeota archaeon]